MPILESNKKRSAIGTRLATGVDAIAGLGKGLPAQRSLVLGIAIGIPAAMGMRALGWSWVLQCFAALIAGVLIAMVSASFPGNRPPKFPHRAISPTARRLADGKARLERLEAERTPRRSSGFGKVIENRIVWGELLELELYDVDEQVQRIRDAAAEALGGTPRKGDTRERNQS